MTTASKRETAYLLETALVLPEAPVVPVVPAVEDKLVIVCCEMGAVGEGTGRVGMPGAELVIGAAGPVLELRRLEFGKVVDTPVAPEPCPGNTSTGT